MKTINHKKTIWTIGHSTRTIEDFINLLMSFKIKCVVDIRRYPGSKRYPQYNQEALKQSLNQTGIIYCRSRSSQKYLRIKG